LPNAPHRVLRNRTVETWEAAGRSPSGKPIVRYQSYTPGADAEGDIDALSLWAGQSVGLVSKLQPAAEIVRENSKQADSILQRLSP
jgi:nitronate monooxygenase